MPKVGAALVHYKQRTLTLACLESMKRLTYPGIDVVLVDNASKDGAAEDVRAKFPHVRVLELPENLGFAGGMNAAIQEAVSRGAEYVLILNNDTLYPDPQLAEKLLAAFQTDERVGMTGGRLLDYDDPSKIQWAAPGENALGPHGVHGAAFMASTRMLRDVGLFDPTYFSYYEESDLFARAHRRGWKTAYVDDAVVQHKAGSPASGDWTPFKAYYGSRNFYLYARKNAKGVRAWWRMFWEWNVKGSVWTARMIVRHQRWRSLLSLARGHLVGLTWLVRPLKPEPRLEELARS